MSENNKQIYDRERANDVSRLDEQKEENVNLVESLQQEAKTRKDKLDKMHQKYSEKIKNEADKKVRMKELEKKEIARQKRQEISFNLEKIKEKKSERENNTKDFEEYYKGWMKSTPLYQKMTDSYRQDIVGQRNDEIEKVKTEKHSIFGHMDHTEIQNHGKNYMTHQALKKMEQKDIAFPGVNFKKTDCYFRTLKNDAVVNNAKVEKKRSKIRLLDIQETYGQKVSIANRAEIEKAKNLLSKSPERKISNEKVLPRIQYYEDRQKQDYQYMCKRNNIGNDYLVQIRESNAVQSSVLNNISKINMDESQNPNHDGKN